MKQVFSGKKYDFLGKSTLAFIFSFCLIAGSCFFWFQTGQAKWGIDYKGGHEFIVQFTEAAGADTGVLRKAVDSGDLEGAVVQSFESSSSEYSIRLPGNQEQGSAIRTKVDEALRASFDSNFEIIKTYSVGPTIGQELRKKSMYAIIIGLIGILTYISFRFDFAFALGAVAALFHDVIVCMGIYLATGHTINVSTLAAALTIVGYSVNDTIIVFDRMREEIFKRKKFELAELMNFSITATLSRTIITSLLTLFSALALLLFGGGAIRDLSVFLVAGVIAGTYSTIFIASPVALIYEKLKNPKKKKSSAATAAA